MENKLRICLMVVLGLLLLNTFGAADSNTLNTRIRRQAEPETVSNFLNRLLQRYDKGDPPRKDDYTDVLIGIYINQLQINTQAMDFSMTIYLRQGWNDPRLKYDPDTFNGESNFCVPDGALQNIWTPDIFFRNENKAAYHFVTTPNKLLKINSTGGMWSAQKITATFSCPMKLQKYPFDTQSCPLMFESFKHKMDTIRFKWLDAPVDVDNSIMMPGYTYKDNILHDCSQNYTSGSFPCLEVRFIFERLATQCVLEVYLPSVIIVILSWLSFWIKGQDTAARVMVGLLTTLFLTLLATKARAPLPEGLPYATALDVWIIFCYLFVLFAVVEFGVVNLLDTEDGTGDSDEPSGKHATGNKLMKKLKGSGSRIDVVSRVAFPVAFLLFTIIYFVIYTLPSGLA